MRILGTLRGKRVLGSLLDCLLCFLEEFFSYVEGDNIYLLKRTEKLGIMLITHHSFTFSINDNYL